MVKPYEYRSSAISDTSDPYRQRMDTALRPCLESGFPGHGMEDRALYRIAPSKPILHHGLEEGQVRI